MRCITLVVSIAGMLLAAASSYASTKAMAELKDPRGNLVGSVILTEMPTGVMLQAKFRNFVPGAHAFHVHAVGRCEPPFKSAGGHYNPLGSGHGLADEHKPHAGDMPNVHIDANGELDIEVFNTQLRLDGNLFDSDGAAIVVHQGPDDYHSDPAGAAGPRIACGVIKPQ